MSSRLMIPEAQKPEFKKILNLTDEQAQDLYSALEVTPPAAEFRTFLESLSSRVSTLQKNVVFGIAGTLFAVYRYRDSVENTVEDVPNELAAAYAESEGISKEDQSRLSLRLARLLGFNTSLGLSAKASDVLLENSDSFTGARIVTDIRPIFSGKEPSSLGGSVVVHVLKIEYLEGSQEKEFFVALDTQDIRILKSVLERAEAKEAIVNAFLQGSGLPSLGVTPS